MTSIGRKKSRTRSAAWFFSVLLYLCPPLSPAQTEENIQATNMKIKLTSVYVKDPAEAFTFYTEVLGFEEKMFVPEARLAIVVAPGDSDGTALLLEPNDNPVAKAYQEALYKQGLPVLVLGTDDIQKEYERLKKLGVVFKTPPIKTEWGTIALFDDTCGNLIQTHQDAE